MAWKQIIPDDPRMWKRDEIIEGILMAIPEPTTIGGFITVQGLDGKPYHKICPAKLYASICQSCIGTYIKIECGGKQRIGGKGALTWVFDVYESDTAPPQCP